MIDEIDARRIIEEYSTYRALIVNDLKLFLDSLMVDLDRIRLAYKYGPSYN